MRSFRCEIPVRFGDIDQAGVAYYPTLLSHCHAAFEEFFEQALGRPYPQVLLKDRLGFPTVHLEADFREALRYGDRLAFEVSVARMGRGSVVFRYRAFRRGRRGRPRLAFQVLGTTACVDMRVFRPCALPPKYRRMFARHLRKP